MEEDTFEKKLRDFMQKELPGMTYQAVISYTDGKIANKGEIQIKTYTIGFDTRKTPFVIAHSLFRAVEVSVSNMLQGVYGSSMKAEDKQAKQNDYTMHR
jgi:hypothetical protein